MEMVSEGQSTSRTVTFTSEMLEVFAALTSDRAPVHFDPSVAQSMGFRDRLVHGLLVNSVFSEMLGCQLPGPRSVIQKFSVDMIAPVYVGEAIYFTVIVSRFSEAVGAVTLALSATNDSGAQISRGTAVCVIRRLAQA